MQKTYYKIKTKYLIKKSAVPVKKNCSCF